ncbi:MAG: cyanophycin synthetase [Leptospira sp.]|nr:cyanophycin synthetase [Leptospira sp.]
MTGFLHLLSELQNPEKTRNFNVFKNYSLDDFEEQLTFFGLDKPNEKDYSPYRISVVGTNGKGSTSYYLAELLRLSYPDENIGLYTSPHLISPLERIVVNGKSITLTDADLIIESLAIKNKTRLKTLSYFEFLTLVCLQYFKNKKCKFEIWEAGLGGRLDATKLVNSDQLVLTKIGLDHREILGNTREDIAFEKINIAGKNTKSIYSFPESEPFRSYLTKLAESKNIKIQFFNSPQYGSYLESNFQFAKWILLDMGILKEKDAPTFQEIPPPKGRLEILNQSPLVLFDPAHNPDAISHTLQSLRIKAEWKHAVLLLGCLPDKDAASILQEVKSYSWERILFYEELGFYKWPMENKETSDLTIVTETELADVFRTLRTPLIALGSFRLYPFLTTLFQKNVNL